MLGHKGEVGGDWGGGDRLQHEVGRLGLGARQFGKSERLGGLCSGSLCGGGSLRASRGHGVRCWDLYGVSPSLQRAGGMYRGGPLCVARVVARTRSQWVAVT